MSGFRSAKVGPAQKAILRGGVALGAFALAAGTANAQATSVAQPATAPVATAGASGPVSQAADATTAPPGTEDNNVADIVVTASRVDRRGYTAPTPTQIVGDEQVEQRGATNVADVLNQLPAFKASIAETTNGRGEYTTGANYVDLRGLGANRTLVLVDNKRFVPEVPVGRDFDSVDIGQIPALLVDRVEVVTGGASADYGSDAVAGVVNFVLKKKFVGAKAEVQYGESEQGDNREKRAGLLVGHNFFDDRLNVMAALDYVDNGGVGDVYTRDWGRKGYLAIPNPCPGSVAVSSACPTGGNGQAATLIEANTHFSAETTGGLINNTILKGTQFGPGGTVLPFNYGSYVGPQEMVGGDNVGINEVQGAAIEPAFKRNDAYGRISYEISDNITAFADLSYSYSRGSGDSLAPQDTGIVIQQDNAFLPSTIKDLMVANNISSFKLGRYSTDIGNAHAVLTNKTTRFVVGLEGRLPISGGDWKWDLSYTNGYNDFHQLVYGSRVHSLFNFAADAVLNPATGQVVCRATLPGPSYNAAAAGCVPINLFGEGSPSESAIGYVARTLTAETTYNQQDAAFNISGEPFSTWAGPVSVAAGGEYRAEKQNSTTDAFDAANDYEANNSSPLKGHFNVKEGYLETVVPLAKDVRFVKSLDLNGAVRVADYSTAGTQTTWKIGATYTPFDGLLFRGTRSRDIRAPSIYELFSSTVAVQTTITYKTFQGLVQQFTSGNTNLQPEVADTWSGGVSVHPRVIPGLDVSLDYYNINLRDEIATIGSQSISNFCAAGDQTFCSLLTFDASGNPTSLKTPFLNIAAVKTSGLDIQASYRFPLSSISSSLPGAVNISVAGNYQFHFIVDTGTGAAPIDRAGEVQQASTTSSPGGSPDFRSTTNVTYNVGGAMVNLQWRHISGGKYDNTFTLSDIDPLYFGHVEYFDLSLSYKFKNGIQIFGVVNNLLDRSPPPVATSASATNTALYDEIGRTYQVGVRFQL